MGYGLGKGEVAINLPLVFLSFMLVYSSLMCGREVIFVGVGLWYQIEAMCLYSC